MKELSSILFVAGLAIEIIAFFIGYAESVPFVYRIISSDYYHANKGIETLKSEKILTTNDVGFQEMQSLFKRIAKKQNTPELVNALSVVQFVKKNAALAFSQDRAKETIAVEVKLSNGQSVNWDLNEMSELVLQLKTGSSFYWALAIFIFGIAVQLIGFRLGNK